MTSVKYKELENKLSNLYVRAEWLSNYSFLETGTEIVNSSEFLDLTKHSKAWSLDRMPITEQNYEELLGLAGKYESMIRPTEEEVRANPDYQRAVECYRNDDQKGLALFIPKIFEVQPAIKHAVYHGITPRKESFDFEEEVSDKIDITPGEYVDKCIKIMEKGLLPSRGVHGASDNILCPVFFVDKPYNAHGCIVLRLNPQKTMYSVFDHIFGVEEFLVYSHLVKADFRMGLKSGRFGNELDGIRGSVSGEYVEFRNKVEETLDARGIKYKLLLP